MIILAFVDSAFTLRSSAGHAVVDAVVMSPLKTHLQRRRGKQPWGGGERMNRSTI